MDSKKKVIYFGADGVSGYANAIKGYIYDLIKNDNEVYFYPLTIPYKNDGTEYYNFYKNNVKKLPLFNRIKKLEGAEVVIHSSPDTWNRLIEENKDLLFDKKIIGRTVWDFDPLPEDWVNHINKSIVNIVSVPSTWCREIFINSGVKKDIIVEPHTIPDISYKKYQLVDLINHAKVYSSVPINFERIIDRVKFLNVSSLALRKNINFIVESYLDTFSYEDETVLILKLTDLKENLKQSDDNIKKIIVNKIKNKNKNFAYAPIIIIDDFMTFDQMQSLYDNVDIYINASNGEGFNLPCFNSKIKNKYIVTPLHGGLTDYLHDYKNLYEVNYNTINISSRDKSSRNQSLWISLNTKGISPSYDDFVNQLKESYYVNINKSIYFESIELYKPYTTDTENSSLFPIWLKDGWHKENIINGVWSKKEAEIVVGDSVLKFEAVLEITKNTSFRLNVDGIEKTYDLKRGQYSFKIISKDKKHIKFYIETTSNGTNIGHEQNKEYGIKLVDIYVNGIKNNTSRLQLREENFDESIFKNALKVINKSVIVDKGQYGDIIIKFKNIVDSNKFNKKISLEKQLSFYSHRSGWNYVLHGLSALNSNNGVYCDGFIENNFAMRKHECVLKNTIPYSKSWIGFIHNPPNMPPWFSDINVFNNLIFKDPYFIESLRKCKGIYTLSEYHAKIVRKYIPHVPVESLFHPTEIPELQFDFDEFVKNEDKKLVTIGWWLRKLNALYTVKTNDYKKIRLLSNNNSKDKIFELEKIEEITSNQHITDEQRKSVKTLDFLSNDEYDKILSENLVYLDLYDCSANNVIIECIARGTPLFINRLPAVVEYLGESYPLYIDSIYDLEDKLKDYDLIRRAHLYLKTIRYKVEIGHFLETMVNSNIYKNL
jgi:hypothetical protein